MKLGRRKFLKVSLGAAAAGFALHRAGHAGAARLRCTVHRIAVLGDPSLRVVHLTDLHVGRAAPQSLLHQALAQTKRAQPDLVALTGDYVNRSLKYVPRLERFLAALPRPCVATLGNHDHWSSAKALSRILTRQGITVLANSHAELRFSRGRRLTVVGVDDGHTGHADPRRAFGGVERPERALVLTHHPNTADAIAALGGRLILAGHTHGGQVAIPIVTRAVARIAGNRYVAGWYHLDGGARLYVNAGLGAAFFGWRAGQQATAEVAVIDL